MRKLFQIILEKQYSIAILLLVQIVTELDISYNARKISTQPIRVSIFCMTVKKSLQSGLCNTR